MKAIILAAGMGTRLNKYTKDLPKGMLCFNEKTLIEQQIETFQNVGIDDITIVTGYQAEKISYKNVKRYHNPDYASTNMLVSLFCAEKELEGEVIVSYADIIYEKEILKRLKNALGEVVVTVDKEWKKYWYTRYGKIEFDLESLSLNSDNTIKEIGDEVDKCDNIDARYVGLIKFSDKGLSFLKQFYQEGKLNYWDKVWQKSGKTFQNAYMTDMLQEFIDRNHSIQTLIVQNGWLEFDTNEDYERMRELLDSGKLGSIFTI